MTDFSFNIVTHSFFSAVDVLQPHVLEQGHGCQLFAYRVGHFEVRNRAAQGEPVAGQGHGVGNALHIGRQRQVQGGGYLKGGGAAFGFCRGFDLRSRSWTVGELLARRRWGAVADTGETSLMLR